MVKNYFTIAIRNLLRHKIYAFINIIGLSIGMACCALILLYVQHELSYDRFHKKSDRIYQAIREIKDDNGKTSFKSTLSGRFAPTLTKEFPEIEVAVRMLGYSLLWTEYDNQTFSPSPSPTWFVDPHFLSVFDFTLIKGDRETALKDPYSLVLSEKAAQRYFGSGDPIGEIITLTTGSFQGDYTVTGVVHVPENSSLHFDMLSGLHPALIAADSYTQSRWEDWRPTAINKTFRVYVLLREGSDPNRVITKFPHFIERHMGKEIREKTNYHLQPLKRIHLFTGVDYPGGPLGGYLLRGDIQSIYLFSAIAFLVLLIACVNFMNLATARSANRAKEVGLRKVSGAHRLQLIHQFLGEAILMSFLAMALALILVEALLPAFNAFIDKNLFLEKNMYQVLLVLGLGAFVGLLSGLYPAFFLSSFQPALVLKGAIKIGLKGVFLRRGLVVFQFAMSILLIISTVTVYQQLNYIQNKNLGFRQDQLVQLPIFWVDTQKRKEPGERLKDRYQTVKRAFLSHPNVLKATVYRFHFVGFVGTQQIYTKPGQVYQVRYQETDKEFFETFDIEILAGRTFRDNEMRFSPNHVILNETAVKLLDLEDPIGKQVYSVNGKSSTVIGVIKDYHVQTLHTKIEPLIIRPRPNNLRQLALKINGQNVSQTIAFLEQTWKQFLPDRPFEFAFIDESLQLSYEQEQRLGQMVGTFSLLAIMVACLGLFGLAAFTAEQRTKEISVRKVLGANVSGIVILLSKEFAKLVLISNLIAWPVAYFVVNDWLQSFAYRVHLSWWVFALSGMMALLIALSTISYQAIRTALANPIESLRQE